MKTKKQSTATPAGVEIIQQVRAEIARLKTRLTDFEHLEASLLKAFPEAGAFVDNAAGAVKPAVKRKYGRKEKTVKPPVENLAPPAPLEKPKIEGEKLPEKLPAPASFSKALNRVMSEAHAVSKVLTVAEIFAAIETRWPDLAEGKDGSNVMVNLSYAAGQGKCEKLGRGALATFRILDADYFKS